MTKLVRKRIRSLPITWANGSGIYREGMAGNPRGLLGRTVRKDNGTYRAWSYRRGIYKYLGVYPNDLSARLAVVRR